MLHLDHQINVSLQSIPSVWKKKKKKLAASLALYQLTGFIRLDLI